MTLETLSIQTAPTVLVGALRALAASANPDVHEFALLCGLISEVIGAFGPRSDALKSGLSDILIKCVYRLLKMLYSNIFC